MSRLGIILSFDLGIDYQYYLEKVIYLAVINP
jgi:hypothetical protein